MKSFFNKLSTTYIIAEIGVNHNGNMNLAKRMILAAKKCGASAVKFQTFTAKNLVSENTPKVPYQKIYTKKRETHYEMIKKLEFAYKDHLEIINFCKREKIDFISTPYDAESAKLLNILKVKIFKTASADITDYFLHNYLSTIKQPVIISTGMSTHREIADVLKIYSKKKKNNIALLHCVSNYPCKDLSINLNCMQSLKKYNFTSGYSDHSSGFLASTLSIALGGKIIEKHFTINKNISGPDQKASSDPGEFSSLVKNIRRAEIILGKNFKALQNEEKNMHKISRKSFFSNKFIKKGSVLKLADLKMLRPGTGLNFNKIKKIIGRRLKKNINKNTMIKLIYLR